MRIAGGIVALVAGVFGVGAAIFTLMVGGVGAAFSAEGADTVVGLGWGGVFFAFVTIVLGAVAIGTKGKLTGILVIASSLLGAILGGTAVAVCMVLSLAGGILVVVGASSERKSSAA